MVIVQSPWRPWTPMDSHAKEGQAQPRGGPSSRSRHSHEEDQAQGACRWLPLRGSRDKSQRNQHQVLRRRSSVEGVNTAQEAQGCQAGEAPEQYSMKKVLSGEREQEQHRWRCCEEVYNHTFSSSKVEWILIHSTHTITSYHFSISIY